MANKHLDIINQQASALAATQALNLTKADAQLALALMWDFQTWDALIQALSEPTHFFDIGPGDLLKSSSKLNGSEKTAHVARQVGRLTNNMARFPELSEKVGAVIPTLYGYNSMSELAKDDTETSRAESPTTSDDLIVQSRRELLPVFTGEGRGGLTLVAGSEEDEPTTFALNAALTLNDQQAIRVVASEAVAQALDTPAGTDWKLHNYPSLSAALSSIISHLQHESNTIFILSLRGFDKTHVLADLIEELNDGIAMEEGNRVIIDAGPLSTVDAKVWNGTRHQVLLQGSLDNYNGDRNALGLKDHDLSQVTGFVSRADKSFSFYLMNHRRDGVLITSLEPVIGEVPAQACSA